MHELRKRLLGLSSRGLFALSQAAILLVAAVALYWLGHSISTGLAKNGIGFDLGFLTQPAGFDISEGWTYTLDSIWPSARAFLSSDNNIQALITGAVNTIKASIIGIALATALGIVVCVGCLSRNWLLRQMSFLFVEFVRNTPPLIQLVFWYFAVVLQLPVLAQAGQWMGIIASRQGVYLPALRINDAAPDLALAGGLAALAALVAWWVFKQWKARHLLLAAALVLMACAQGLGDLLLLELPQARRFAVSGGFSISPELGAMLLGLIIYKSAFIAEIMRGAMLSLPEGQPEAAQALGLSRIQSLRDVILPQVYRIVLPAFGNQYISLAKNTSLGIAVGFPDLFNVYGTVSNQSGRSLEGMVVVVLAYLVLSWTISLIVNLCNRRLQRAGGAA